MPIKDKITHQLKNRFLEEIKRTRDTGKEHGFPICMNRKGELFAPEERCEGEECSFVLKNLREFCPYKTQGGFHTHTYLVEVERFYGRKPTEKEIERATNIYKRDFKKEGISLQSPSHHDLVSTLSNRCTGETEGTVCTGTDLDLGKVECWTVNRKKVKAKDCSKAKEEYKKRVSKKPREWIKPLFDKEIINL